MSTPWTWSHESPPSAQRPPPQQAPEQPPGRAERLRRQVLRFLWKSMRVAGDFRRLVRTRTRAVLISGEERHGGGKLVCLYVGTGTSLEYVKQLLHSEGATVETLGESTLLFSPRLVSRHEARANLVVVDVGWPFAKLFSRGAYLETPTWVNQNLPLGDTWQATAARLKTGVKRNHAQRSRKHRLTASVTHDEAAARRFYREMFLPHLERRFGRASRVEPEEGVLECCTESGLLEVSRDGVVLGASVLVREGDILRSAWSATRPDLDNQLTSAVFGALYYYTITFGHEHGFALVDYCDSRANLSDGVLGYKRQWGARVGHGDSRDNLLIRPRDFEASTRSFFVNNPFLLPHGRDFRARVLRDDKVIEAEDLKDFIERNAMDGIAFFDFCSTLGFDSSASEFSEREPRVRLVDLSRSSDKSKAFCRGD